MRELNLQKQSRQLQRGSEMLITIRTKHAEEIFETPDAPFARDGSITIPHEVLSRCCPEGEREEAVLEYFGCRVDSLPGGVN